MIDLHFFSIAGLMCAVCAMVNPRQGFCKHFRQKEPAVAATRAPCGDGLQKNARTAEVWIGTCEGALLMHVFESFFE